MRPSNHPGHVLPQDTAPSDGNQDATASQPVSLSEVDDLLYGEDRPADLRLDRLRELADDMRTRSAGDIMDDDAAVTLREIERAITTLEAPERTGAQPGMVFDDPLEHRETLSPDSDELEEIEEGDEASIEDDIGGDGLRAADDDEDDEEDDDEEDDDDEEEEREGDIDPPR
jgi:hypothetical protein